MFVPGKSGNEAGRPKGSKNKVNIELREEITDFLKFIWPRIKADFLELEPAQRIAMFDKLSQFSLPKMTAAELTSNYEQLTDSQLDDIIEKLKSNVE